MRPAHRPGTRRWLLLPATILILSGLMATGCSSSSPPTAPTPPLIGAGFLAIAVIDFLREVDAVIAAGRTAPSASE